MQQKNLTFVSTIFVFSLMVSTCQPVSSVVEASEPLTSMNASHELKITATNEGDEAASTSQAAVVFSAQPLLSAHDSIPGRCTAPARPKVNWSGCDLRNADLRGALLRSADLRNADLRGADLGDAILFHANLVGADLRGVDLSGAMLDDADLRFARLDRANLDDATLVDADLRWASGLPLPTTAVWVNVLCPNHSNSDSNGRTCQNHFSEAYGLASATE